MTRSFRLCALLVLSLAWTFVASSQQSAEPITVSPEWVEPTGDLAPGAQIVRTGQSLAIADAIAMSIQNDLDVEVARFAPLIARADSQGVWGAYDPSISADMGYDVAKAPNSTAFFGSGVEVNRQRIKGGGAGIDQLIPYVGATLSLRYESSATATRREAFSLSDQFDSSLFFRANVPLARNLIWSEAWTQVKTAKIGYEGSLDDFRAALMDTVQTAVNSYWNLVAARDQVRVAQKSLETARALLDQTKTEYEVGVVSRVEVVESEAGVADREFDVIRVANDYRNAQDELIDTVLGRELAAMTDLHFAPTEDPEAFELRKVDVQRAVNTAFRMRPVLRKARLDIEQDELELKFAKNQRLPQFDVDLGFGYVGMSGEPNPRYAGVPSEFLGPFDQSTDDFFNNAGSDNYSVKGTFSIPFPNTTARKRVNKSEFELRRSKTQQIRQEQEIVLQVRKAARTLLASAQGIQAAERRRLAAEEQLRAERIRLEHGESTPFEVLQRESDLVEAESQKINALQTYRAAEVGLERAQGTILDTHNVVVEEAREPAR
ncbi:MAG: hypothetical protein CL908_07860 [Deltaproteobacteria bacterium]|nr:hypothetical protein [Deltaproteobacteria bacterium]